MDGPRLDAFARQIALSRRGVLRTLAGGAAAGALALVGRAPVLAKPHPRDCMAFCDAAGLTKQAKGQCHHDCAQGGATGLYAECHGDLGNLCPTPAGPVCHDLANDPAHCGSCAPTTCPAPQTACVGGACACPPATPDFCDLGFGDRQCVNLATDPNFCGGCHNVCVVAGATCVGGQCVPPTCPSPFIDRQTDPLNCGTCGTRCRVNETCVGGACQCGNGLSGPLPPFVTCCPNGDALCSGNPNGFVDAATCDFVATCPAGSTPCVSAVSNCGVPATPARVCCPSGTACDVATGTCFQG